MLKTDSLQMVANLLLLGKTKSNPLELMEVIA